VADKVVVKGRREIVILNMTVLRAIAEDHFFDIKTCRFVDPRVLASVPRSTWECPFLADIVEEGYKPTGITRSSEFAEKSCPAQTYLGRCPGKLSHSGKQ
jgi:hypothetical protein